MRRAPVLAAPRTVATRARTRCAWAVLASLPLAAACEHDAGHGAPPAPSSPVAPALAPLPKDLVAPSVLVRAGSYLHTHVPPAGDRARNPRWPPGQKQEERFASRYTLVQDFGEWVLIETAAEEAPLRTRHCQTPPGWPGNLALRLYVARADLAPVLTRPLGAAFDDGTRVDLGAGAPLSDPLPESAPAGQARRRAFADGIAIAISVPDDAVGFVYGEPQARPVPAEAHRALQREAEITLDGRPLKLAPPLWGSLGLDPSGERRMVYREAAAGGAVLVDLEGPCGRYRARVDASAIGATTGTNETIADDGVWPVWQTIRKGARLYWRDGSPAGTTRGPTPLSQEGVAQGGRRCFDVPVGAPGARVPESTLPICVGEDDAIASPSHRSDEEVARIGPQTRHYLRIEVVNGTPLEDRSVLAIVRATAKNELLSQYGDAVAIAPPGETAAEAKKKAPGHVQRLLVRLELLTKADGSERHSTVIDEGASPPIVSGTRTSLTHPKSLTEVESLRRELRGMFRGMLGGEHGFPWPW